MVSSVLAQEPGLSERVQFEIDKEVQEKEIFLHEDFS
jgi:hypothetical protein